MCGPRCRAARAAWGPACARRRLAEAPTAGARRGRPGRGRRRGRPRALAQAEARFRHRPCAALPSLPRPRHLALRLQGLQLVRGRLTRRPPPNPKILDVGSFRRVTRSAKPLGGTLRWMIPDVFSSFGRFPHKAAGVVSSGNMMSLKVTSRFPLRGCPGRKLCSCQWRSRNHASAVLRGATFRAPPRRPRVCDTCLLLTRTRRDIKKMREARWRIELAYASPSSANTSHLDFV
ncbi:unnamed protein product [Prorocentrum cordatum]|uniref:Uncharacterized protein n=1 Tax=Prorocentrum cordatum TaxID=2364126 RepID=A0ABN9UIJ3_9DINO|nr:unnamed protein product [Polarella glacialis]